MIYGILRKAKEKVNERAAYRLKMQNNIPFRADWRLASGDVKADVST